MVMKLFDAELKVMGVLWRDGATTAKRLVEILSKEIGWNKSTTYTNIRRCLEKGAIERVEPDFICRPLITIGEAREYEAIELINKMYDGAADQLVTSILDAKILSKEELKRLKRIFQELE